MKKLIIGLMMLCSVVYSDLITTFDFELTTALTWTPPGESGTFYYNVAYFTVSTNGSYTAQNNLITSHDSWDYGTSTNGFTEADTYIYLYKDMFQEADPNKYLIAEDDDGYNGGNGYQFELTHTLESGITYWAVISTYDSEELMSGDVNVLGPAGSSINITTIPEPYAAGLIAIGGLSLLIGRRLFR